VGQLLRMPALRWPKSLICAHASDVCLYMLTPDIFIHRTLVWGAVARFWTWVTMSVLLVCNRVDIEVMYNQVA